MICRGDKVRCTLNDPFNVGDKNFKRRTLQVVEIDEVDRVVWCQWRELVDGRFVKFGNWLPYSSLVKRR